MSGVLFLLMIDAKSEVKRGAILIIQFLKEILVKV